MKFFSKLSFKWKLTTMTLSILTVMALAAFFNLRQMKNSFEETFLSEMQTSAKTLGEKIKAQFYERYGDVQAFALNRSVKSMNGADMQSDLDEYTTLYGIYDLILVVDTKGQYVSSNTKDPTGAAVDLNKLKSNNYADTPWFKAVMASQFTEDKKTGFVGTYFENIQYDPLFKLAFDKDKKISTSFSAPIKNAKGEIVGVVTNRANSKWYESEFITMFDGMSKVGDIKAELYLAGKDGTILFKHVPFEHDGKNEAVHEENVLFKDNYFADNEHFVNLLKNNKEGYATGYDPVHKINDLQGYYKLNGDKWIEDIGWHVFISEEEKTAMASANQSIFMFYLVQSVCILLGIFSSIFFAIAISKKITSIADMLQGNAAEVDKESNSVAASALQLSESSTEQAAALQETVAAVDEISAMVEKNSEGADKSREMSTQSKDTAERGRQIVENMVNSIRDIEASNSEISDQMAKNSSELSEIVKLIADIETKTKVINEIVFQTKLLSFNASVEAARAGEYGKGFAVVAEEVGNLAQMSGRAANEISTLLNESVTKVETIVSESKVKVNQLMSESQNKVQVGTQIAEECGQALNEILNSASELDILVSEIATASKEQSTGIREISKAVGQMEQVTQETSNTAQSSSATAENLKSKSGELKEVIASLNAFVNGGDGSVQSVPKAQNTQNVVSFKPKKEKKSNPNYDAPKSVEPKISEPTKKASGDFGPSAHHPGFKD